MDRAVLVGTSSSDPLVTFKLHTNAGKKGNIKAGIDERRITNDTPMDVPVQIVGATGLAKADMSLMGGRSASDPFCEVRWDEKLVHKTAVVSDSVNPTWTDETALVPVDAHDSMSDMVVSVWDSDGPMLKGDFLGQVIINGHKLMSSAGWVKAPVSNALPDRPVSLYR